MRLWKKILIAIVLVASVFATSLAIFNLATPSATENTPALVDPEKASQVKACQVYPFSKAQQVLGPNTTQGDDTPPVINGATIVSSCSYTNGAADTSALIVTTVTVRSSTDDSSIAGFNNAKPANAQPVTSLGDAAYWNPETGQLNILKGRNWAIITAGSSIASERTASLAKQVGVLIAPAL